jgi:hypothetical protein
MKFSAEKPRLRKAAKRCLQFRKQLKSGLIILLQLLLLSCGQSIDQLIYKKILIYERHENEYFKDVSLELLRRDSQNPLEYEMRRKGAHGKARFQVRPDKFIYSNFHSPNDTIGTKCLSIIDSLDIRALYNSGDTTEMEFWVKDNRVILYRVSPLRAGFKQHLSMPIVVLDNWAYFSIRRTHR